MVPEKWSEKGFKREFLGSYQMNRLTEFDLYIDIVSIVQMFCAKIFLRLV